MWDVTGVGVRRVMMFSRTAALSGTTMSTGAEMLFISYTVVHAHGKCLNQQHEK